MLMKLHKVANHSLDESTMKMALDWSTFPQAGKWRSKIRSSYTNESTSKPGTPQMDTPTTRLITA
jgi:hypothetical protein